MRQCLTKRSILVKRDNIRAVFVCKDALDFGGYPLVFASGSGKERHADLVGTGIHGNLPRSFLDGLLDCFSIHRRVAEFGGVVLRNDQEINGFAKQLDDFDKHIAVDLSAAFKIREIVADDRSILRKKRFCFLFSDHTKRSFVLDLTRAEDLFAAVFVIVGLLVAARVFGASHDQGKGIDLCPRIDRLDLFKYAEAFCQLVLAHVVQTGRQDAAVKEHI